MKVARFASRVVIGGLFIGHGTQKLFGWFEGPGLDGTRQMMSKLDMAPEQQHALTVGLTETTGGALVAAGLATPAAAAGLIGVMITAIRKVHWRNGPWSSKGGFEYNLVLIGSLLALAEAGPGELSLDHALGIDWHGTGWAVGALAVAAAASVGAVEYGRRQSARTASYPSETNDQRSEQLRES